MVYLDAVGDGRVLGVAFRQAGVLHRGVDLDLRVVVDAGGLLVEVQHLEKD